MKLTDGNAPGGGSAPPEVSVHAVTDQDETDTLGESIGRLVGATKELAQAELAFAKARGAFLAKRTLVIAIAAVVALIIAFSLIVTLMIGAVLALAPLIGIGLALLAVTGVSMIGLAICAFLIKGNVSRIVEIFA